MNNIKSLFLQNSYNDIKNNYQKVLDNEIKSWDIVVLTASNDNQAKTYEIQLEKRKKEKLIPTSTEYVVIPDVRGKRIGSGGATLNVLVELNKTVNILDKKILIIHSGGDSKRVPQYSSIGKLFAPVPREYNQYRESSLFDEMMMQMSTVPQRMDKGIFIMCGDSLVLFNPLQLDLQYKKAAVISMKMPKEKGTKHGVFVSNKENIVTKFLHKQPLEILEKEAVENDYINFDTGMIYFNNQIVGKLLNLVKEENNYNLFISEESCLNVYGDFLYPLALDATQEEYLKEGCEKEFNDELKECRLRLWKEFNEEKLKIVKLSPALFLHFGTTKELLDVMTTEIKNYTYLDWTKKTASFTDDENITAINSIVVNSTMGTNLYVENSVVENCKIGDNVILSGVKIKDMEIPSNIALSTLPLINGKYVTRIYDISLNPKDKITRNSKIFNFNNEKFNSLFSDKDFWNAKIYPTADDINTSVEEALKFYKLVHDKTIEVEFNNYLEKTKTSFYESFNNTDTEKLLNINDELSEKIIIKKVIKTINQREDLNELKSFIDKYPKKDQIIKIIKELKNIDQMRLNYLLYLIEETSDYQKQAFSIIKSSLEETNNIKQTNFNKDKIEVQSPVRVNFGGGWSDTPPYCIENGGTVLNAAIKVNDNYPINVTIEKIKDKKVIFSCIDFNDSTEIQTIEELRNCSNPNDPYALLKCAVIISNLVLPEDKNLNDLFKRVGAGVKITTNTKTIPRGSGLGTSSILSGTVLKAIYKFMDIEITDGEISYEVLKLEQLMSTGGGWQDQVGGLLKGIKLIKTEPGKSQILNIKEVKLKKETLTELNKRLLLINTSQRRLARNLLRDVMGKYISGNKETLEVLSKIQDIAQEMTKNLEDGNLDGFAKQLNEHWELSKKLDIGCTNTCIDFIFDSLKDLISGQFICGAGGGGFLLIMLRKNVTKDMVDERINEIFQDSGVETWSLEIEV